MTDDRSVTGRPRKPEAEFDAKPPGAPPSDGHTALDTGTGDAMADPECGGPSILEMLGDDDCRKILTAVEATALSASEIAESCDLSSSTTYRKVETLTDLGLLSRTVRIRANGVDVREYTLSTENILVRFQEDEGPRVQLAGPEVTEYLCGPQPD